MLTIYVAGVILAICIFCALEGMERRPIQDASEAPYLYFCLAFCWPVAVCVLPFYILHWIGTQFKKK